MRYTIFALLVITIFAVTMASPAYDKKSTASRCNESCTDNYTPICAKAKNSSKERLITFGNKCVMGNYNCQHADDPFEEKTKGECGGNVSVRLS